jgi:hypothetical protein
MVGVVACLLHLGFPHVESSQIAEMLMPVCTLPGSVLTLRT